MSKRKNKKYSKELKHEAVQAYLKGEGSLRQVCRQYEIRDKKQLRNWILWYNGHKEFKERQEAGIMSLSQQTAVSALRQDPGAIKKT